MNASHTGLWLTKCSNHIYANHRQSWTIKLTYHFDVQSCTDYCVIIAFNIDPHHPSISCCQPKRLQMINPLMSNSLDASHDVPGHLHMSMHDDVRGCRDACAFYNYVQLLLANMCLITWQSLIFLACDHTVKILTPLLSSELLLKKIWGMRECSK